MLWAIGSSVTYPRPGYASELLLWISLHRAQAGCALVKQQHHFRQMHSNVLWWSNILWPAKVQSQRNWAFAHQSQAVKVSPCNKQLPVVSCLLPFSLSPASAVCYHSWTQNYDTNYLHESQQKLFCICGSVYMLPRQLKSTSSRLCCTQLNFKHTLLHPRRQTCSRRLGQTTTDSTPWAATSFSGPQQPHTLKHEHCWDLQPLFMRWETDHKTQMHVLSFPANLLSHFSALFSPTQ